MQRSCLSPGKGITNDASECGSKNGISFWDFKKTSDKKVDIVNMGIKFAQLFHLQDKEKESYEKWNKNINFEILKLKIESNKLNLFRPHHISFGLRRSRS